MQTASRHMKEIYLDNNATTPVLPAVWEAMRPFLSQTYGNPASAHWAGRRARQALEDAREQTASLLGAYPDEVVFTSGATEANNLAIFGLAGATPGELITSPIEHPSVAEPVQQLGDSGWTVKRLPVCRVGIVQVDVFSSLLTPETRLVCVMLVNNETGALQPIAALARLLDGRATFQCDAAQAAGKIRVQFHELGVTTLSLSAHKFHGPKGVGVLLVRRGTRLPARSWGGHQQAGLRPGTEPVALAIGLAAALNLAQRSQETHYAYVSRLRDLFLSRLSTEAGPVVVNGPAQESVPHTLNVSFPGCRADALLMNLDLAGVACSTGSACSSGSLLPSPVLQAMGVPAEVLGSAMRFSFSPLLSEEEILEAAQRVAATARRLRATREE